MAITENLEQYAKEVESAWRRNITNRQEYCESCGSKFREVDD